MSFRNSKQKAEFDGWWQENFTEYFPKVAQKVEADKDVMWAVEIAYQMGLERMASIVQTDALSIANMSEVKPSQ